MFKMSTTYNLTSCPSETPYVNAATQTCMDCIDGSIYNVGSGSCQNCEYGTILNINTGACDDCDGERHFIDDRL